MKKSVFLLLLFSMMIWKSYAQGWSTNAEVAAMGYSTSGMQSAWSVFHNPAGSANITDWTLGSTFTSISTIRHSRPSTSSLAYSALLIAPIKNASIHFTTNGTWWQNGNSNTYSLGYAHMLSKNFRLGIRYSYTDINLELNEYSGIDQSVKLGGQLDIREKLTVGLVLNGRMRSYNNSNNTPMYGFWPSLGTEYRFTSRFLARADLLSDDGIFSIGAQYYTFDNLFMRCGVSNFQSVHAGLGVVHEKYQLDISGSYGTEYGNRVLINISGAYKF